MANGNGRAEPEAEEADEAESGEAKQYSFRQPELVTGATLRDYQLAGVQWMISLYENGLNGILADEMGLGKTLQTISFLAHLRAKGTWGPFLIVCPLSVLNNWMTEFEKFCPIIPVCLPSDDADARSSCTTARPSTARSCGPRGCLCPRRPGPTVPPRKDANRPIPVWARIPPNPSLLSLPHTKSVSRTRNGFPGTSGNSSSSTRATVSRTWIASEFYQGGANARLIRELKTYTSANRMILTGTPLHVSLPRID